MGAYIHHAAYYTGELDWYIRFFGQVFGMEAEKQRTGADGLREVWLFGGIQLCETAEAPNGDGRAAHLCLIVDDLEAAREKALAMGCGAMEKHHWIRLPDGLCVELFAAAEGAVEALAAVPKRK